MNPNVAQSLDPKLKETYDRIMGTQINVAPKTPTAQPTHVPVEHIVAQPQATPPAPEPKTEMVNINSTGSDLKAAPVGKKGGISPIVFIAAGVGFFLIYTFIWLKVFKVF